MKTKWWIMGLGFFVFVMLVVLPLFSNEGLTAEKNKVNSLGMEFVLILPGSFAMGSPLDEPFRGQSEVAHEVEITRPFYMQATEVTIKQWRAVMGKRLFGGPKGADNMPVAKISWYDTQKFIKKLNTLGLGTYRLPTEAEWEYAARAGTVTAYSWGEKIDCSKAMYGNNPTRAPECVEYAKSRGFKPEGPAPVKSFPPNAWGLYDMHCNVWEWCQDFFVPYELLPKTDPLAEKYSTNPVRRGGSWFKHGYSCRSANRAYGHAGSRLNTTGFRVVLEIP